MKVAIIGAGNMGGSIARGLAEEDVIATKDIIVSDPSTAKLDELKMEYPELQITTDNQDAVAGADYIILAVKPWLVCPVLKELRLMPKQVLVSVAAGVSFEELAHAVTLKEMTMFRLIPNTAIRLQESMTLIACRNTTQMQEKLIADIFNRLGKTMFIPEEKMTAGTALSSCGIAYALKYVEAAVQAGVEMGIYPKDARRMVAQSLKGAAELMLQEETHTAVEIEKVCTPGGITIKGINELEHNGFTSAIIKAMKVAQ
jgi:pyrroline-5-carboxylate reductase